MDLIFKEEIQWIFYFLSGNLAYCFLLVVMGKRVMHFFRKDCRLELLMWSFGRTGVYTKIHLWVLTVLGAALKLKVLFASYYGLEVSIGSEICFGQGCSSYFLWLKSFRTNLYRECQGLLITVIMFGNCCDFWLMFGCLLEKLSLVFSCSATSTV